MVFGPGTRLTKAFMARGGKALKRVKLCQIRILVKEELRNPEFIKRGSHPSQSWDATAQSFGKRKRFSEDVSCFPLPGNGIE